MPAPAQLFPLRWESTGDQWWYASPIDWAAANGHYDLVRELLHLDPNLLIKLTSLRRIRRLETVWDDHSQFQGAAVCRAHIAKNLLFESENKGSIKNSLIGAGYGGWLLYTAAAAGDTDFVSELIQREPLLVFGEGEYGVTDILYAAARSKNSQISRLLLNLSLKVGEGGKQQPQQGEVVEDMMNVRAGSSRSSSSFSVFRWEMMNRAAHAAARGGDREMMREIILAEEKGECGDKDVLAFRDAKGSTLLHSASARGQIEVVKDLVSTYGGIIVTSTDNHGNRALNVAVYRGHLQVVQILMSSSSSSQNECHDVHRNCYGDTFLHMAVAGFTNPGFRRLDRQMNLMKYLTTATVNLYEVINVRNKEGRTALHCAAAPNIPCEVLQLLMTVPYIDLNIRDHNGMTPLDLLLNLKQQQPRQENLSNSNILIKRLLSAGGLTSNNVSSQKEAHFARRALASHLRSQSLQLSQLHHHHHHHHQAHDTASGNSSEMSLFMVRSPGVSFRISDADILFYAAQDEHLHDNKDSSYYNSSQSPLVRGTQPMNSTSSSQISNNAATRLKILLRWPNKKKKNDKEDDLSNCYENDEEEDDYDDNGSRDNCESSPSPPPPPPPPKLECSPTPLRQRFAKQSTSLPKNKRVMGIGGNNVLPLSPSSSSPITKKIYGANAGAEYVSSSHLVTATNNKSLYSGPLMISHHQTSGDSLWNRLKQVSMPKLRSPNPSY